MFPDGPEYLFFTKVISYALVRTASAVLRISVGLSSIDQVEHASLEPFISFNGVIGFWSSIGQIVVLNYQRQG